LDASGPGYASVAGSCEHGNESSSSINGGELFISWVTISFLRRLTLHGICYVSLLCVLMPVRKERMPLIWEH